MHSRERCKCCTVRALPVAQCCAVQAPHSTGHAVRIAPHSTVVTRVVRAGGVACRDCIRIGTLWCDTAITVAQPALGSDRSLPRRTSRAALRTRAMRCGCRAALQDLGFWSVRGGTRRPTAPLPHTACRAHRRSCSEAQVTVGWQPPVGPSLAWPGLPRATAWKHRTALHCIALQRTIDQRCSQRCRCSVQRKGACDCCGATSSTEQPFHAQPSQAC